MNNGVARCYLNDFKPSFSLPMEIIPNLYLISTKTVKPLHKESINIHNENQYCLEFKYCDERRSISLLQSIVYGIHLSSDCSIHITAFDSLSTGLIPVFPIPTSLWGHYSEELTKEAIDFSAKYYEILDTYSLSDKFSRISNAFRLHIASMITRNCDLALLGFVSSLESLFSISPQELSFRLSITIGKFMGDDNSSQREYFERAKRLYTIRSKLSHGDKIFINEEQTAISIVDNWAPEAEELNRACLKRILEKNLIDIFLSNKKLEKFLIEIIFSNNLDEASSKVKT